MKKAALYKLFLFIIFFSGSSYAEKPKALLEEAPPRYLYYKILNSKLILRMSHIPLGRFDTPAENALNGILQLNPQDGKVRSSLIEFQIDKFKSLIGLRDEHIKNKYLEMTKFPVVQMKNAETLLSAAETNEESPFVGSLVVKGVTTSIGGKALVKMNAGGELKGNVEFKTKVSLFPIPKPWYFNTTTEDEVTLLADFVAAPVIVEELEKESPAF